MKAVKSLSVSEFKAKALGILDDVAKTGQRVTITKHGKPIAQVLPYAEVRHKATPGRLAGTVVEEGDIVSPLGADAWLAAR